MEVRKATGNDLTHKNPQQIFGISWKNFAATDLATSTCEYSEKIL